MGWGDRVSQYPVVVDGFAASVDLHRRLWQLEVLPCSELPLHRLVLPLDKQRRAPGYVGVFDAGALDGGGVAGDGVQVETVSGFGVNPG
jgi:hypothetical protein